MSERTHIGTDVIPMSGVESEPVAMADVLGPLPPGETECGFAGECKRAADTRIQVDYAGTRYVGFSCKEHEARGEAALREYLRKALKNGNLP